MTSRRLMTDSEIERREASHEALRVEQQVLRRKLDSKCEALLILSKELDQCRSERDQFKLMAEQLRGRYQTLKKQILGKVRDQFKLMAEQLRGRYQTLKKQILGKVPPLDTGGDVRVPVKEQDVHLVLFETREQNKSLLFELEDLKQKLHDANGDIKLLREQIARQRVGTADEGMNMRHFPAHERETLVQELECAGEQYTQLERDLQQVIDEKEELVTERDVYKTKYERLNQELNYILKGDEKRVVDIDALVMENKYLLDRMKQMEEEKSMAMATASKYKTLLERKKTNSALKLGQSRSGGLVISQKQVHQLLEDKASITATPQAMTDLQALATALLETVNDKNMALSHQRRTNKILGTRVSELEKKIKTLEVAGLWNIGDGNALNLEKLKAEYKDVLTLMPQLSQNSDLETSVTEEQNKGEIIQQELIDQLEAEFCSPSTSSVASPEHDVSNKQTTLDDETIKDYFDSLDLSPAHRISQLLPGIKGQAKIQVKGQVKAYTKLQPCNEISLSHTQVITTKNSGVKSEVNIAISSRSEVNYDTGYRAYAMEDLDLLPTKEDVMKCVDEKEEEDILRITHSCDKDESPQIHMELNKFTTEPQDSQENIVTHDNYDPSEQLLSHGNDGNYDNINNYDNNATKDGNYGNINNYDNNATKDGSDSDKICTEKLEKLMTSMTSKMINCSNANKTTDQSDLENCDNRSTSPTCEDSLLEQSDLLTKNSIVDDPQV